MVQFSVGFFFFNDTATTEIYTLSLHDALPICSPRDLRDAHLLVVASLVLHNAGVDRPGHAVRSEEHTSELQSHLNLVCRLLLENNTSTRLSSSDVNVTHSATGLV